MRFEKIGKRKEKQWRWTRAGGAKNYPGIVSSPLLGGLGGNPESSFSKKNKDNRRAGREKECEKKEKKI